MKEENNLESQLTNYIKEAEERQKVLVSKQKETIDEITALDKRIMNLKETLRYHLEKIGKVEKRRFSNIKSLGEACEILIKENKKMTTEQLINKLQAGGYNFQTEKKPQTIFFAVMRNPNIDRTEKGVYKWKGK